MHDGKSRTERIFEELENFLSSDKTKYSRQLYKTDARRLKKYIEKEKISVTYQETEFSTEKVKVTLKKF